MQALLRPGLSVALLLADLHFGRNRPDDVERAVEAATSNARAGDGIVVIAGDFTQRATTEEYVQAEAFLRGLIESGSTVVATPGNHDFGLFLPMLGNKGTDKVNVLPVGWDASRRRYRRHISQLLAKQEVERETSIDGYDSATRVGDDVFVALRTTHRSRPSALNPYVSRVRKRQARWAYESLEQRGWSAHRLHFVTHRSLWRTLGPVSDKHRPLKSRGPLESLLAALPFRTFIHGHNHALRFERVKTPECRTALLRIGLPTLSDRAGGPDMPGRAFAEWIPDSPDQIVVRGADGEHVHSV